MFSSKVQVSVVYLRSKILRLLGNANKDGTIQPRPKMPKKEIIYAGPSSRTTTVEHPQDMASDSEDDDESVPNNKEVIHVPNVVYYVVNLKLNSATHTRITAGV